MLPKVSSQLAKQNTDLKQLHRQSQARKLAVKDDVLSAVFLVWLAARVSTFFTFTQSLTYLLHRHLRNVKNVNHRFPQMRCRLNAWLGVEPKITKQRSGLQGGKCYHRNTHWGIQMKEKNDTEWGICLLAIFTNLQKLYHHHWSEKGSSLTT